MSAFREDWYRAFTEAHLSENEAGGDINRQIFRAICAVVDLALKEHDEKVRRHGLYRGE